MSNGPTFSVSIESLLAPIAADSPAGESLRYEGTYDRIAEARREDDATLPQGEWKTALKIADWKLVASLCTEALTRKSKDLQIAAWLMEAWIEIHGLRGCDVGLQLMTALADRYWETGFPELDREDPSARLAPLAWIDDKLSIKLKKLPLTRPQNVDASPFSIADFESAQLQERQGDRDGTGRPAGTVLQAKFMTGASLTPAVFYTQLSQDLEGSIEAAVALEQLYDSHLAEQSVTLRKLKEVLDQIKRLVSSLHGTAIPMPLGKNEPAEKLVVTEDTAAPAGLRNRLIQNRADAYRLLIEASDYLLLTEPHSPTPYLVKRAISWGDMPLGKVLEEIVPSPETLAAIYSLLGIRGEREGEHREE